MSNSYNYRLPVKREPVQPPALWQQAAPVVVRGAALVAAGVIGEWLLRSATKKAASLPFAGRKKSKSVAETGIVAVEELLVFRRTIVRRG